MVYFKKNENLAEDDFCDFDVPELEGIFIIGDLEGGEKMKKCKKTGKVIAVVSAVCAAAAGVIFAILRFTKKQKV